MFIKECLWLKEVKLKVACLSYDACTELHACVFLNQQCTHGTNQGKGP